MSVTEYELILNQLSVEVFKEKSVTDLETQQHL